MEWMRCNACWLKVEEKKSLFHLTQCGHVYCDKCILQAENNCFQCGSEATISLPLKEPLSPQIAHYFTRPIDLMEKATQAAQFQESQLSLYLKRTDAMDSKYQSLKEAYWVAAENLKKVVHKYNKLKMTTDLSAKEQKQQFSARREMYTPSQFRTPPMNQVNNPKYNQQAYYAHNATDSDKGSKEVFRVPSVTRVPRSAGYFSASSTSSRMTTPHSNYSRY